MSIINGKTDKKISNIDATVALEKAIEWAEQRGELAMNAESWSLISIAASLQRIAEKR
jgi:hypothetical protein